MRADTPATARGVSLVVLALGIGLPLSTPLAAQEAPLRDSPSSQAAIIDTVVIEREGLFSDDTTNPFFQLFNSLHAKTRTFVLRRELLLGAGMPYDSLLASESERNLRRLGIFRSVRVDSGQVNGRRALFVRTRDSWTLQPQLSARIASDGTLTGIVGVTEKNVGGTGNAVRVWYLRQADRDGLNLAASSNRIGASNLAASFSWLNLSDRDVARWSLSRPFRSFSDRWSLFYDGFTFRGRELQYHVFSPVMTDTTRFRNESLVNRVFATYAPIANAREYLRVGVTAEVRRQELIRLDPASPVLDRLIGAVPDTVYGQVGAFIEYRRSRFARVRHFNGFADEDQDLSDLIFASINLAPEAWGYASTGVGARLLLASGARAGPVILKGVVDGNALFNSAGLDSGRVVATTTAALNEGPRHTTFVQVSGGVLDSPQPGREFDLGFEVLPRLWGPHAFAGTRSLRATIEHRFYAIDNFLDIMGIGFGAFVDYGGAWYAGQDRRFGGDTGVAMFLGSSLGSTAQISHISAGYRFGGGVGEAGVKRWQISLGSGIIF